MLSFWRFTSMKICPTAYKICPNHLDILPNTEWPKFLTVCQSGEISPNLVTLDQLLKAKDEIVLMKQPQSHSDRWIWKIRIYFMSHVRSIRVTSFFVLLFIYFFFFFAWHFYLNDEWVPIEGAMTSGRKRKNNSLQFLFDWGSFCFAQTFHPQRQELNDSK